MKILCKNNFFCKKYLIYGQYYNICDLFESAAMAKLVDA